MAEWPPFYPERWEAPTTEPQAETAPSNRPWRERFPNAERIVGAKGGAVYTAEAEGAWWVITDEGAMADLLDDDDIAPAPPSSAASMTARRGRLPVMPFASGSLQRGVD